MKDNSKTKPPLGCLPKKLRDEINDKDRFDEVRGAIARFLNAGYHINPEWVNEHNELLKKIKDK